VKNINIPQREPDLSKHQTLNKPKKPEGLTEKWSIKCMDLSRRNRSEKNPGITLARAPKMLDATQK
jgi:hypothetical protein